MKTLMQYIKYSFILFLCTSVSCNKNDDIVIPTGDHTFSCYINGEFFVPKGNINSVPYDDGLSFSRYELYFYAKAKDFKKFTVFFNLTELDLNTYSLSSSSGSFLDYTVSHAIVRINGVKYLSKENSGTVTFTKVTETDVKGTFEFTLYNENDESDVIQVTNGNFDN
ncbi:MAG: hypothetical protein L3J09_08475 [Flavobacteriaceae bacterium]|nr:hypothetical protein [Flavobacteriaceae bacterium]